MRRHLRVGVLVVVELTVHVVVLGELEQVRDAMRCGPRGRAVRGSSPFG